MKKQHNKNLAYGTVRFHITGIQQDYTNVANTLLFIKLIMILSLSIKLHSGTKKLNSWHKQKDNNKNEEKLHMDTLPLRNTDTLHWFYKDANGPVNADKNELRINNVAACQFLYKSHCVCNISIKPG